MSPYHYFACEKNRLCILTSKNLNKHLFFIVNGNKTDRCHLYFINSKAGK